MCVLEDTSTMERTTVSANCIDLEIINQTITIITGAEFCISDQDSVLFLVLDGLPIRQTLSILTTIKGLPDNSHDEIVKKAQELKTRHSGLTPTTTSSPLMLQQEHRGERPLPVNDRLLSPVRPEPPLQMQSMGMIISL